MEGGLYSFAAQLGLTNMEEKLTNQTQTVEKKIPNFWTLQKMKQIENRILFFYSLAIIIF